MDLHLINRTKIADASGKITRFMEREYELYDGIDTPHDSTLSLQDILISIMMNSRLDTADKVRSIWDRKASVETALAKIPNNIALEDDTIPWDDLRALFDAFCCIRWAKEAVTTKILYRKRPKLIPMIDSKVANYLNEHNEEPRPRGMTPGKMLVRDMMYFRKLLLGSLTEINDIRNLLEVQKFPVSAVRVLEVLIWNECVGYY